MEGEKDSGIRLEEDPGEARTGMEVELSDMFKDLSGEELSGRGVAPPRGEGEGSSGGGEVGRGIGYKGFLSRSSNVFT